MWVLRIELRSFGETASALSHGAIFSAPYVFFFFFNIRARGNSLARCTCRENAYTRQPGADQCARPRGYATESEKVSLEAMGWWFPEGLCVGTVGEKCRHFYSTPLASASLDGTGQPTHTRTAPSLFLDHRPCTVTLPKCSRTF